MSMTQLQHQRSCGALRSIAGPESCQAPRSTWTVSRCPGDRHLSYAEQNTWSPWHILTCVWKSLLLCTLRRPLQAAQHQKKAPASVASMGWRVYLHAGRCSSAASEDWPWSVWTWPGNHPIVQGSAEYTERSQDVTVGSFLERIWYGLLKDRW